jgi:PAS domain S-box-containing protein
MINKKSILDEEIELDPKRYIVSQTNEKGKITFCNDYFIEICGYSKKELIGQPHNIIRHPDMPKIVFKLLWKTISQGNNINAVVKNLAKDGRYYWIFTEFESVKNLDTKEIIGYTASRRSLSKHVIDIISKLYSSLLRIEKKQGIDESEKYLIKFLKSKGKEIEFSNIMDEIHRFY